MTTLIAFDYSGSTGHHYFYHSECERIVKDIKDPKILLGWDTRAQVLTQQQVDYIRKNHLGFDGTDPSCVADYIRKTGFTGDLVLITDGQVGSDAVERCRIDQPMRSVTVHLIPTGYSVNMSVSCPFTRNGPHTVYQYVNSERQVVTAVTGEDLATKQRIHEITTIAEFDAVYPALDRAVVAATMGSTGDPSLRDALLAMKARIQRADAKAKGGSSSVAALIESLEGPASDACEDALAFAITVTNEYYVPPDMDTDGPSWSSRVNRLVSMTEGALRGTFDLSGLSSAIRSDRARRAPVARQPTSAPPTLETEGPTFECPITYDEVSDVVLLLAAGPPLLQGLDKDTTNSLFDCPLNLLLNADLVAALKARLDHPVSMSAFKEGAFTESPMTRRGLAPGGLCLGASEEHCRATTWTLANLFTGGKLVGNQDLWFACIWFVVASMEYLAPIEPMIRAQLLWRLSHHTTSLSITGNPDFPTTRVPLRVALWYVFASPRFQRDAAKDLVRAHLLHLDPLRRLYELAGFTLTDSMEQHVRRVRVLLNMLAYCKRPGNRFALADAVRALHQGSLSVDVASLRVPFVRTSAFVPIDGPPSSPREVLLLPQWRDLPTEVLVGLASMVDPSKSAADVPLAFGWKPPPLPPPVVAGFHGLASVPASPVKICPATCRPYFAVRGATWKEAAHETYGFTVDKIAVESLSVNEEFGNFVVRYNLYPSRDEFITYLFNRRLSPQQTLPYQTEQFVAEVLAENADVMATLEPAEFARRFVASRPIDVRQEIEKRA